MIIIIIISSVSPWKEPHTSHKAQGLVAALDATTRVPALASPPGAVYRWTGVHFSTVGPVCILTHHSNPRTELVRIRNALHLPAIFIVRLGPLHCATVYMVEVVEAVARVPRSWPEPNSVITNIRVNICTRSCLRRGHLAQRPQPQSAAKRWCLCVRAGGRAFKVCTGPHTTLLTELTASHADHTLTTALSARSPTPR